MAGRWRTALLVLAALAGCSRREAPPNVVVLSIDTLRADFVGCCGAPEGVTPFLDRLARGGVVCADAVSTSSWTLPAHMSLLTGQYPSSHGVIGDGRSLPEAKETLAEYLRARGYRTAGFVSGPYLHRAYGFAQGFDIYEHCVGYGEQVNARGRIENVIRVNLRSHRGVTGPKLHGRVSAWLDGVPVGRPYFLFVHYWDPHYDFEPPFPFDRFLDPGYRGRMTGDGFLQNRHIRAGMPAEDRKRLLDLYRGEIRWTDGWIGRLLFRLEQRGELERSLVVVVGDHGEEFFEHGGKGHRHNLYEETLRIPVILRLPGALEPGRVLASPVSLVDVFPTVADLVDAPPPARSQGVALREVLAGETDRRGVFAELHLDLVAFRGSRWKAILDRESGREELYFLAGDPGERENVRAAHPAVWRGLAGLLQRGDHARYAPESTPTPVLDPATEEELRALGYTD